MEEIRSCDECGIGFKRIGILSPEERLKKHEKTKHVDIVDNVNIISQVTPTSSGILRLFTTLDVESVARIVTKHVQHKLQ